MYNLEEGNVKLKLTIVDSVGYGDQINKENRYPIYTPTSMGDPNSGE